MPVALPHSTLDEAFVPADGGRPSVANNARTLELTVAVPENITWTALASDFWEVGGPDGNWNSTDTFFVDADHVIFDDTVNGAFSGTITIAGNPQPGSVTFNNSVLQDYLVDGAAIGGTGGLTKDNDGLVELANTNFFTGDTVVNNGTLVLSGGETHCANLPDHRQDRHHQERRRGTHPQRQQYLHWRR